MPIQLNPYLNFRNEARDAMAFYQSVFGGTLRLQTFKDFHASEDPSEDEKVMHAELHGDNGIIIMGADTPNNMELESGASVNVSLSGDNEPELRGYYEKLSNGGTVLMPLDKAPWGDTFGMCIDKFGIRWLVNIAGNQQA